MSRLRRMSVCDDSMRIDFSGDRVLAVVAHPDDAELLCAGTLARARDDGAAIGVCILCRGDKGQPLRPIPNLPAVRRKEARAASKLLRAELYFGEFADGTLSDGTPQRLKMIEVYRLFRPTLVLAHSVEDYHPDHRAAAAIAEAASWFCASRGYKTRSPSLGAQPAVWFMDTLNMNGFTPEFYIDVSPYASLKDQMLLCHGSQLQRKSDKAFSPLGDVMRRQYETRGQQCGVAAAEAFRAHDAYKRSRAW